MRVRPRASEERSITSYAAAVAVGVLVFFAGAALDARWHPVPEPEVLPFGVTEAAFTFATAFLLVLGAALVPVLLGLAAFRRARVTHPAWFAVYGAATGLLLGNLFGDLNVGLLVPSIAGAAGGLTFRGVAGRPAEPPAAPQAHDGAPAPADHLRTRSGDLFDLDTQAAYLSDALASDDPALVVLALKEIGTLRRIPVALDENPPLGEILRSVRDLGLDLGAAPAATSKPAC